MVQIFLVCIIIAVTHLVCIMIAVIHLVKLSSVCFGLLRICVGLPTFARSDLGCWIWNEITYQRSSALVVYLVISVSQSVNTELSKKRKFGHLPYDASTGRKIGLVLGQPFFEMAVGLRQSLPAGPLTLCRFYL